MKEYKRKEDSPSLLSSQRGMSLPVTFLMLFVSLIVLISATYYFSIIRINMKTQAFKVSGAEQEMLSLEKIVSFVAWSPGASHFYEFGNFGGEFQVEPIARRLVLNLTDDSSFQGCLFQQFDREDRIPITLFRDTKQLLPGWRQPCHCQPKLVYDDST